MPHSSRHSRLLRQDGALGAPALPPRARKRRAWIAAATTAVAAVAAVGIASVLRDEPSSAQTPLIIYPHSVAVIDPAKNAAIADILVGDYPGPIAADASFVYVCNIGDATLSRIDPERLVASDFGSFSRATDLVADRGDLWAADGGAPGHTPLAVGPGTLLHYSSGPTWQPIRVGPAVDGPDGWTTLAANGRGRVVWAGNAGSATIRELDASSGRTLWILHGIAPGGLAIVADTVWATDPARGGVVRIDGARYGITARIPVGGEPT